MNNSTVENAIAGAGDVGSAQQLLTAGLIATVLGIILASGLVGGVAAYLTQVEEPAEPADGGRRKASPSWLRFVLLGVIAAACVPLFLSLVRSKLLTEIFAGGRASAFEPILVFTGLCLIAAFTARAFIDSISRRVLQQVEQIKEKQNEVEQKTTENTEITRETRAKMETLTEVVDDQAAKPVEPAERLAAASPLAEPLPPVSDEEQRVLNAVAAKTYRTVTGITEDSGFGRSEAKALLQALSTKGLVEPTVSPSGGLRWKLTALGRTAANQS